MSERLDKYRKQLRDKSKIPAAFIGMQSNFDTIQIADQTNFLTIKLSLKTFLFIAFALLLFGPYISYLFIFHPEKWNPNLPLYVRFSVTFLVTISWLLLGKFTLFPKKIIVNKLNGDINFYKSSFSKSFQIKVEEIQEFSIQESIFYNEGDEVNLYTLVLHKTNGKKIGLFMTTNKKNFEHFFYYYHFKKLVEKNHIQSAS